MSLPSDKPLQKLQFYVTTAYNCGYLSNKLAQSLIASPQHLIDTNVYNKLIQQGFRRSGKFAYRPHCENCRECVPIRIILTEFVPSRSQKRAYNKHRNLTTSIGPVLFNEKHYELYAAYQKQRHSEENLNNSEKLSNEKKSDQEDIEQYQNFLCQTNVESVMVEFRENSKLIMVSVIDIVSDGISAVYTFYDTVNAKNSYGTYNILWQIEWANNLKLPNLYLGYWIKDSKKMAYKENYQQQEKFIDGQWLK